MLALAWSSFRSWLAGEMVCSESAEVSLFPCPIPQPPHPHKKGTRPKNWLKIWHPAFAGVTIDSKSEQKSNPGGQESEHDLQVRCSPDDVIVGDYVA